MATPALQIHCAGHGLGNATRILAIIEELRAREPDPSRLRIEIATWGNALTWLSERAGPLRFGLTALEPFRPSPSGIPAWLRNCRKVAALADQLRPRLVLLDSDLHFAPLFRRGIPLYWLGQAHEVLRRARLWRLFPRNAGEWKSLLVFETLDAWIQNRFAHRIFVPCAHPRYLGETTQLRPVPLIVRHAFLATPTSTPARSAPIGMLLSGSGIEAQRLTAWAETRSIRVIPSSLGEDGQPAIDAFRAVIIQGGLSSISECIARKRAMIVVPIAEHFEQRVNAFEVELQGLGGYLCENLERDGDAQLDRLKVSSFLFELPEAETAGELPRVDGAAIIAAELIQSLETHAAPAPRAKAKGMRPADGASPD